jgi:hypothetical protein
MHYLTVKKGYARTFSSELIHILITVLLKIPKVINILRKSFSFICLFIKTFYTVFTKTAPGSHFSGMPALLFIPSPGTLWRGGNVIPPAAKYMYGNRPTFKIYEGERYRKHIILAILVPVPARTVGTGTGIKRRYRYKGTKITTICNGTGTGKQLFSTIGTRKNTEPELIVMAAIKIGGWRAEKN